MTDRRPFLRAIFDAAVAAAHPDVVAQIEKLMRDQHAPNPDFPFPALDNS